MHVGDAIQMRNAPSIVLVVGTPIVVPITITIATSVVVSIVNVMRKPLVTLIANGI
jgi:hypothetical protein